MILSPMRFGDYVWPHNPRNYEISYQRRIISHKVPFGLYELSDLGRDARIMRGEGEFVGNDAYDEFKELACQFYLGTPRILVHPVWQAAPALFYSLKLSQKPRHNYVAYEFEFWECYGGYNTKLKPAFNTIAGGSSNAAAKARKTYTLVYGDTLWGVAIKNGLSLEELIALNPQIKNPNLAYAGETIFLS